MSAATRYAKYNRSEKGRARQARYQASEKGKARMLRYHATPRGHLAKVIGEVNHQQKRRAQ